MTSDLIQRLERATSGEFDEDYSEQDYLRLCHEALAALKAAQVGEAAPTPAVPPAASET